MAPCWRPWFPSPLSDWPSHHANASATAFKNPWPSAKAPALAELLQAKCPLGYYEDLAKKQPGINDVSVVVPDWGASDLEKRGLKRERSIVGTTLGHAGVVTEFPLEGRESFWVVYDPIFSLRAGPTRYTGPKRLRAPPCQVADLPGCDAVVISHNHYDHLDLATIKAIFKKFPKARYFVPLGNKGWIFSLGVPQNKVYELDWWQNREYYMQDLRDTIPRNASEDILLRFTCVPAQHNSGRGVFDQSTSLWCGWVIEQLLVSKDKAKTSNTKRKGAIYHAGDTGYRRTSKSTVICPIFKEIGQKFGPFDLSFVPIWRGGSLGFLSYLGLRLLYNNIPSALHSAPADTINIHKDVLSRNTVGVHFGTFVGSENESLEAIIEFTRKRESQDVLGLNEPVVEGRSRAGILNIGESIAVEMKIHEAV